MFSRWSWGLCLCSNVLRPWLCVLWAKIFEPWLWHIFLKGPSSASFSCIFVFSNNHYNFTTNKCEKCPSSIWCWVLNPRPLEHESPPISTRRPGLLPCNPFRSKYNFALKYLGTRWRSHQLSTHFIFASTINIFKKFNLKGKKYFSFISKAALYLLLKGLSVVCEGIHSREQKVWNNGPDLFCSVYQF